MSLAVLETDEVEAHDSSHRSEGALWLRRALFVLWLPLIVAAIVAPLLGPILQSHDDGKGNPFERVGLSTGTPFRPFSHEAIQSGFRAGDRVLAVDGVPLAGSASGPSAELAVRLAGADGTTVRLTTRSADGAIREHRLTRTDAHMDAALSSSGIPPRSRAWFLYLISLLSSCALTAAAILLFVRGRQRRVPMLLSFGLAILSLSTLNADFLAGAGLTLRAPMLTGGFTLLILALMLFPNGTFHPRWMRWVALALLAATPLGMFGVITTGWPVLHSAFLLAAAISLVVRYRHLPSGTERQQIRWALFGFGVGAFLMVPTQVIEFLVLPGDVPLTVWLWSQNIRDALNILLLLAVAGGLIVSLLRYRLYDADVVIARSVSFGALALALLALFAGTERVIELLGEEWFHEELGVLAGGIGAAVAALTVVPLHHRLRHWAEHHFQKDLFQLRKGLPALVDDMRETAPAGRIGAVSLDWVSRGVRASRAVLIVDGRIVDTRGIDEQEAERWLAVWTPQLQAGIEIAREDRLFPLRVPLVAIGRGRVGWLLLGPRPDGSLYGKDERDTLEQIADPVARALEIAAAREKREAEEQQRWRGQEDLNAEIKAVNSELIRILASLDEKIGQILPSPAAPTAKRRPT